MNTFYVLSGKIPVPCDNVEEWARWIATNSGQVALDTIGDVRVSTVFLGISVSLRPLMLFETMIFGGPHDKYQMRCATWEEAEAMHRDAVAIASGNVDGRSNDDQMKMSIRVKTGRGQD